MNRGILVLAPLASLLVLGCGSRPQPSSDRGSAPANISPTQPNAIAPSSAIPAAQATGYWNRSQVESYVKDELKLSEVSLISAGGEDYSGTGKGADGKQYTLTVKQVPGGIACEFRTDTGGGRIAFGNQVN